MPQDVGYPPGSLAALAAQARAAAGIPQPATFSHERPVSEVNSLMKQFQAGGMSAAQLLQLLMMQAGVGGVNVEGGAAAQTSSPIHQAMMGGPPVDPAQP